MKIKIGMIGGAQGAEIAESHRIAMRMDNRYELVAGLFSRSREKSLECAKSLAIDKERTYETFSEMAEKESARSDGIQVVSIVTPSNAHYAPAKAFLSNGIHVICDKPITNNLEQAHELHTLAVEKKLIFGLTHNYSAYAMIRHASKLVRENELGDIRIVQAEHATGWAAKPTASKQALWRFDPAQSGIASVLFDVGTHAHHLLRYITGLEISELSAEMHTCVPDRKIYDDVHVNLRLSNGARGSLWASVAATGQEHGLRIRVFGSKASLEWRHEYPHYLTVRYLDGPIHQLAQGHSVLSEESHRLSRLKLGHPEGFLESFANVYTEVANAIEEHTKTGHFSPPELSFPTAKDGVLGVLFVNAVVKSFEHNGMWTQAFSDITDI